MNISRMADTLGGLSVAAMIYTPMARSLFGTDTIVYFVAFGILLLSTCLSPLFRRQNVYLYLFIILAVTLVVFELIATFANGSRIPTSTFALLVSTLMVGIICALRWGERFYRTIVFAIVTLGTLAALFLVRAYLAGGGDFRRTADTLGYLTAGALVALPISLLLPHLLSSKGWKRLFFLLLLAPLCIGLIVALARGALLFTGIAGLLALMFYWPRQESRRRKARTGMTTRLIVIGLAVAAGAWFMPRRTLILMQRLLSGEESESGGRGEVWAHAWQEITASPLFGHGFGYSLQQSYSHPHNMFLQVGMDTGLVGMVLIVLLMLTPIVALWGSWKKNGNISPLTIGFFLAFVVLLLDAQKSGDFYTARTLMIFSGLVLSHSMVQRAVPAASRRTRRVRQSFSAAPAPSMGGASAVPSS